MKIDGWSIIICLDAYIQFYIGCKHRSCRIVKNIRYYLTLIPHFLANLPTYFDIHLHTFISICMSKLLRLTDESLKLFNNISQRFNYTIKYSEQAP